MLDAFWLCISEDLEYRILEFDNAASLEAGQLAAQITKLGKPVDFRHIQIAGIVKARKATLATANSKDFMNAGIQLINPWGT